MLSDFIISTLLKQFEHKPTPGQEILIQELARFVMSDDDNEMLLIKGYAGTGKTSIISSLVKAMRKFDMKTYLLAPTGRAAKVFSTYAKKTANTIHKKIFRQKSSVGAFGNFLLDANLHSNTVFIVDEASMISNNSDMKSVFGSGHLLNDLIEYTYNQKNCKLILVGDTAQLPPVRLSISPALDKSVLESYGKKVIEVVLTDVVRQSLESGILYNATLMRKIVHEKGDDNSTITEFPKFALENFSDVKRVSGSELIEEISSSYDKYGMEETMILCRSNKRANLYNQGIRNTILFREDEISAGDYLMVVRNNYFWLNDYEETDFIANGDIIEITRIKSYEEKYGFRFANISGRFVDYNDIEVDVKVMLDTLTLETANMGTEQNKKLFFDIAEEYSDISNKKKRYQKVKKDEYFNALQIKFAYAVTCHKAQGGQWKSVFIDQGFFRDDMLNLEYMRWLYTAFTRSTEQVQLVNFKNSFFNDTMVQ